jgi:aminoglycoside-2''-adenylyltransferase
VRIPPAGFVDEARAWRPEFAIGAPRFECVRGASDALGRGTTRTRLAGYSRLVAGRREDGGDFAHLWAWEPLAPRDIGEIMSGFPKPWWICGGWATDVFLGRETRRHDDLDVAVLRRDQHALHSYLRGWELRYATPEHTLEPWAGGWLDLPVHGIWARRSPSPTSAWVCEFLLNEAADDEWVFRRNDTIRRPLAAISAHQDGIPYLRPEIVLLYRPVKGRRRTTRTSRRSAATCRRPPPPGWPRRSRPATRGTTGARCCSKADGARSGWDRLTP